MLEPHHKRRWVFSPIDDKGKPAVAEHALTYHTLLHHKGRCMAYCVFNAQGLRAAREHPELRVLPSLHSSDVVHADVVAHYKQHGLRDNMITHDALVALAAHHPSFEPED